MSGTMVANGESGIQMLRTHSQLSKVGLEPERYSKTCRTVCSLAITRMAPNIAYSTGNVSSMGRQPAIGLYFSRFINSACFCCSFCLSLAYFFCSALISG